MKNKTFLTVFFTVLFLLASDDVLAMPHLGIFPQGLKPPGLVFAGFLIGALVLALAVHELGHLLTGLAQGFQFHLFVVFLLGIKRTEKGIRVYLNKNLGYMGGVAVTIPVTQSTDNKRKFALMILAGPLASLLFAVVCFLFVFYTRNMFWSFWLIAGAASFGLVLATTIPSRSGIFFTDRARFQRLISKGQAGRSEEALLEIIAQTTVENSCKNLSLSKAQVLQDDKEAFMRFWGYYYEYEYAKANDNIELSAKAKVQLTNLKQAISAPVWKALKLDE